jgi:hypothetical protein
MSKYLALFFGVSLEVLIGHIPGASGQLAPHNEVWSRTMMMSSPATNMAGTTFSIDVDSREYWITAKHILTGAQHPPWGTVTEKSVAVKILQPEAAGMDWLPVTMSVLDGGKDIDIVVLAAPYALLDHPLRNVPPSSAGSLVGGGCAFLGFWVE